MADNAVLDGVRSERTETDAGEVRLLRGGEGPPLLFLHGQGAGGQWTPYHRKLATRFEVLAPTHPGMGGSELLEGVEDVHDLAFLYIELLDRLGLGQVVVAGESFGGWLAAELAVHAPHRVSKLVIMGAPGLRIPAHMPLDVFLATPEQIAGALFHDSSIAMRMFPADPSVDFIVGSYIEMSAFARYGFAPFLSDRKLERRLRRVAAPALVLWADDDRVVPLAHGERYAECLPAARLQLIPDCGHAMSAERPDAAAEAIISFAAE